MPEPEAWAEIVVMDNLQVHKTKRVRELIEGRGCSLVFLPSYSPDFNPIEEAFSKVKTLLRKAKARSFEALVEATGAALRALRASKMLLGSSPTADTQHRRCIHYENRSNSFEHTEVTLRCSPRKLLGSLFTEARRRHGLRSSC